MAIDTEQQVILPSYGATPFWRTGPVKDAIAVLQNI